MQVDIILYEPEIPPNTGNVIRLAANSGARLHLVEPLGFNMDDTRLRRAGLDYHALAHVKIHPNWPACRRSVNPKRIFAVSTKGTVTYADIAFRAGDALLFGPETRGLPQRILEEVGVDATLRIPMQEGSRSLNLANAVSVVIYEAWRQAGFS